MKKLIAVLLVLLVAGAMVFAAECSKCGTSYRGGYCPYCTGANKAYRGEEDDCQFTFPYTVPEAKCHEGYWDAKNKMNGN